MLWYAWASVLFVGGMWLYLSTASMIGGFLKQKREAVEAETSEVFGSPEGRWPQ